METLASHAFVANLCKCSFRKNRVEYLGNLILGQGIEVDPSKIKCILDWQAPRTVKGVGDFSASQAIIGN